MTLLCGAAICAACGGTLGRKAPAVEDTDVQARDTLPTQTQPAQGMAVHQPAAPAQSCAATSRDELTLCFVGDIMMGTTYPSVQLPANDGKDIFRDAAPILKNADVACGNLEGAMTDGGTSTKRGGANSYSFRMPTRFAPLLTEAGFDFLGLANNHANDFGADGIASTERCLTEQGIGFAGIKGHTPSVVREIGGVRYGFCAFGHNRYTLRTQETEQVRQIVGDLAKRADIVIVCFHGGAEGAKFSHLPQGRETFLGEDRGSLREFARVCIDAGADVVYGHGPHVTRAVDMYKGRFIAYSLGNFCTPYGISVGGVNGYAPIVEVKIDREGRFLGGQIHSLVQQRGVGPRMDASCTPAREMKRLSESDCPQSGLSISNEGTITLKK